MERDVLCVVCAKCVQNCDWFSHQRPVGRQNARVSRQVNYKRRHPFHVSRCLCCWAVTRRTWWQNDGWEQWANEIYLPLRNAWKQPTVLDIKDIVNATLMIMSFCDTLCILIGFLHEHCSTNRFNLYSNTQLLFGSSWAAVPKFMLSREWRWEPNVLSVRLIKNTFLKTARQKLLASTEWNSWRLSVTAIIYAFKIIDLQYGRLFSQLEAISTLCYIFWTIKLFFILSLKQQQEMSS